MARLPHHQTCPPLPAKAASSTHDTCLRSRHAVQPCQSASTFYIQAQALKIQFLQSPSVPSAWRGKIRPQIVHGLPLGVSSALPVSSNRVCETAAEHLLAVAVSLNHTREGATMSSNHAESISLRPSIESAPSEQHDSASSLIHKSASMAVALQDHRSGSFVVGKPPSHDHCDGHHDKEDSTISISSTSKHAGQTIAPFLAKHIPQQYAPLGLHGQVERPSHDDAAQKDPNTKFCYRHRPDLKCRRTADEPLMENLQRV